MLTEKDFKHEVKRMLPEYLMIDGKGYFLVIQMLVGDYYRISYAEFDFDRGGAADGGWFIDSMSKSYKDAIEETRVKLNAYDYKIVYKLETKEESFHQDLTSLINRYNKESGSNTPDFILASYIENCLRTFEVATQKRDKWYGKYPWATLEKVDD